MEGELRPEMDCTPTPTNPPYLTHVRRDDTHLRRFIQIKADAKTRPSSKNFEERKEGEKAMRQIYNDDGTVTEEPRIGKRKVALRVAYCGFGYRGSQVQPAETCFRTIEVSDKGPCACILNFPLRP